MADVRVTSTGDRRVTSTGDVRITGDGLVTFVVFDQRVQATIAASTLVTFDQTVGEQIDADTLFELRQAVRKNPVEIPAATVVTFDQTVRVYSILPAATLVTLDQRVQSFLPATALITLRQSVFAPGQAPGQGTVNPTRITLDGTDITDICSIACTINASEGGNRTAVVTIINVPKGPLNLPGFNGREVVITRIQSGVLHTLFTGVVDEPRYTRYPASITLNCSDLRNERIGTEDRAKLKTLTGGTFSPITQREDATGESWVSELMRTVEGSLDYTGAGSLRYRPWALGAPRYTLTAPDIHYRELQTDFANRSQIVNRVKATLEYRHFQRNTIAHAVSVSVPLSGFCTLLQGCLPALTVENEEGQLVPQIIPTKAAILQASQSVGGWALQSLEYHPIPDDGWYRSSDDATRRVRWAASQEFRDARAMGADVELERYISQAKRETYSLTVESPESIDQYGAVEGSDIRVSEETNVDPSIFEERGCAVISNPDDRRAQVETAIECLQRMAAKTIRSGHRANAPALRYKPKTGRHGAGDFLPIEIGDVLAADATEIQTTGFVTEFQHRSTEDGDIWTDIKLAVSRVDSSVSVTEDWTLPAAPATYKLQPEAPGQLSTPECPAPVGEVSIEGSSRIEPDGTVIIIAPAVDRSKVDEISGTRERTYPVAIPKNPLEVVVI